MTSYDILSAIGCADEGIIAYSLEEAVRARKSKIRFIKLGAAAAAAAIAASIYIPSISHPSAQTSSPSVTAPAPIQYDTSLVDNLFIIDLSKADTSGAVSKSTYIENSSHSCRDKIDPFLCEYHGDIEKPYYHSICYSGGRYYACVVSGYNPDYTKSECGGWHFEDAILKSWYEVDMGNGSLKGEALTYEPKPDSVIGINNTSGHYTNTNWTSREMESKEGYYCKRGADNTITLFHYDKSVCLIGTDIFHAYTAAVGDSYVLCCADEEYIAVDIEKKDLAYRFPSIDGDFTVNPLFIYEDNIYCDRFSDYNGIHNIIRICIKTGETVVVQEDVPTRNLLSGIFQNGHYAFGVVSEGYSTEGKGGIYLFDLERGGQMTRIQLPEKYIQARIIGGTITAGRIFFCTVISSESTLFSFDPVTGVLDSVWHTDCEITDIIYAGELFCAMDRDNLICGRLE